MVGVGDKGDSLMSDKKKMDLSQRLARLQKLEAELIRKGAGFLQQHAGLTQCDFFVLGAMRRTLAQSTGFRALIEMKNFPCAAGILRMQIDSAMRINALTIVDDREATAKAILDGTPMNRLKTSGGVQMSDAHLRDRLAEKYAWVIPVYQQTSDFIHLSGRHFYSMVERTDDATRMVYFSITGEDPTRPEDAYYEIVDTFFEATKLVATLILAYLMARGMAASAKSSGP